MNRVTRWALLGVIAMAAFAPVQAKPLANSNNSAFYYDIGGARSISFPANAQAKTYTLQGDLDYGLGYSCGKFDPTLGLSNIINDFKGNGNDLIKGAKGAVKAAIAALPALILQRLDPGLYDLFQNALIRAEAALALANQTCEDYEQEINQGTNPFAGWKDLSKILDWKLQMGKYGFGSSKVDVVEAKENVEKANGAHGVPWIGGKKAGGKGQRPIRTTHDVVLAGYNLTLNRKADTLKPFKTPSNQIPPRLVEVFKSPADATRWAVDVLGDVHIRTHDNRPVEARPGHGLLPKIEKDMAAITTQLNDLVTGKKPLTVKNLSEISSNAVLINGDVINAIQTLGPSEQAIAISKLASEAAMAKVIEKALLIRRLFLTGSREPNVAQTQAGPLIEKSVAQLDQAIQSVLFERRVHTELASGTPARILDLHAQHQNRARMHQNAPGYDKALIEAGAVK